MVGGGSYLGCEMKLCRMVRRRWNSTATEEVAGFQHLCASPSTSGKTYIRPPKTYSNIPSEENEQDDDDDE